MAKRFLFMVIARGQDGGGEEPARASGWETSTKKVVSMVAFLASVNEEIVGIYSNYSTPIVFNVGKRNNNHRTAGQMSTTKTRTQGFSFWLFSLTTVPPLHCALKFGNNILENFIKKSESCFYILHNQWGYYLFKLRKIAQICEFRFWNEFYFSKKTF